MMSSLRQVNLLRFVAANNFILPRSISTSDGNRNSAPMSKTTMGLPKDLVNQNKLRKTSRTLSTLENHSVPQAKRVTIDKDESRDFMAVFPEIVHELTETANNIKCPEAAKWLTRSLQYNVPHGKKNRGLITVSSYKNLMKPEELTAENLRLAHVLGWCVEMLQGFFVIVDDVMDNSTTRRGQKCWHVLEDVGMIALNDALMIENAIYTLLKKNFRHLDCYLNLMEIFHEICLYTTCGQALDVLNSKKNVADFTMDNYKSIVANKTSYYSFYLPFALAMYLAGFKDSEAFRQSKTILLEMGHFFQVQDDFLDCFGNPDITGKIGTDIQDNKCSWLAVVCMQRANAEQKKIMSECYGQSDPVKVARIKELYKELGLPNTYATYEEETYNMIKTHIQQTSRGVPHSSFLQILDKIFQRTA